MVGANDLTLLVQKEREDYLNSLKPTKKDKLNHKKHSSKKLKSVAVEVSQLDQLLLQQRTVIPEDLDIKDDDENIPKPMKNELLLQNTNSTSKIQKSDNKIKMFNTLGSSENFNDDCDNDSDSDREYSDEDGEVEEDFIKKNTTSDSHSHIPLSKKNLLYIY